MGVLGALGGIIDIHTGYAECVETRDLTFDSHFRIKVMAL